VISDIVDHLDYVVVILLAVILYRLVGRPLSRKL